MIFNMKRHTFLWALTLGLAAGALSGCSTVESRISDHPEIYNSISPNDQALVREGRVRSGMPQNAVWLAWGSPDQKFAGNMRGRETETWVYVRYQPAPYGYGYPRYGYPYGPYYGFGFTRVGVGAGAFHHHGHHRFVFFGDPFFDPFYYSYIPPSIPVPYKTVTFSNGRVMSFQYMIGPYS